MLPLPLPLVCAPLQAAPMPGPDLARAAERAGRRHGVPPDLLVALAWVATHGDPDARSAWGGWGLYDFREHGEGEPDIEAAAVLLERSPDAIRRDPALQVEAAAALLRAHAEHLPGGPPDPADIEAWAPAVAALVGFERPLLQRLHLDAVYGALAAGFTVGGHPVPPRPVDVAAWRAALPLPAGDYYGNDAFVPADPSNYTDDNRAPSEIDILVIHVTQGSYSGAISWFANPAADVSAHYVIRSSDGDTTQTVWEEDIAWHAGNWDYNVRSIGIEHEGYVDDPSWFTEAMYQASAELAADIVARTAVTADRSHIIGHSEVPHATHTDPGIYWDWDHYMDLVTGGAGATLVGRVAEEDIYTGAGLAGATVTLLETGETTVTGADALYRFEDLPPGTWTASAHLDGYEDATCTKEITSSGEFWCSIALFPAPGDTGDAGGGATGADTGSTGGSNGGDTGAPGGVGPAPPPTGAGWDRVPWPEGCATGGPIPPAGGLPGGLAALAAVGCALFRGRRHPGPTSAGDPTTSRRSQDAPVHARPARGL